MNGGATHINQAILASFSQGFLGGVTNKYIQVWDKGVSKYLWLIISELWIQIFNILI